MKSIHEAARARAGTKGPSDQIRKSLSRSASGEDQRWSFGFRFFREIKNFGLDSADIDKKWMLSALYRLQELSQLPVANVMEDPSLRDGTLRIHDIDWNARSIPIKRDDLDWIDANYRDNPQEFPLFQVAVSKAEGRLVGFLDEANVFQIVLLDPLHNAQPSKYNDYKVRLSKPLGCEVTSIRYELENAIAKSREQGCGCDSHISAAMDWRKGRPGLAIVMPVISGTEVADADKLIAEGFVETYVDIFAAGLVAVLDGKKSA